MNLSCLDHVQTSHGLILGEGLCNFFWLCFGCMRNLGYLRIDLRLCWCFHGNFIFGKCQNLGHCLTVCFHHIFTSFGSLLLKSAFCCRVTLTCWSTWLSYDKFAPNWAHWHSEKMHYCTHFFRSSYPSRTECQPSCKLETMIPASLFHCFFLSTCFQGCHWTWHQKIAVVWFFREKAAGEGTKFWYLEDGKVLNFSWWCCPYEHWWGRPSSLWFPILGKHTQSIVWIFIVLEKGRFYGLGVVILLKNPFERIF